MEEKIDKIKKICSIISAVLWAAFGVVFLYAAIDEGAGWGFLLSAGFFLLALGFYKGWFYTQSETTEKTSDNSEPSASEKSKEELLTGTFERLSGIESDYFAQSIKLGKEYYYYNKKDSSHPIAKLKVIQTVQASFVSSQIETALSLSYDDYILHNSDYACISDAEAGYNRLGEFFKDNHFPGVDVVPYPIEGSNGDVLYTRIFPNRLANTKYEAQKLSANELESSLEERMKEDVAYIPSIFKLGTVFYGRCKNEPITKYIIIQNLLLSDMTVTGEVVTKQIARVVHYDKLAEMLKKKEIDEYKSFFVDPKDIDLLFKSPEELKSYEDSKEELCSIIVSHWTLKKLLFHFDSDFQKGNLYGLLKSKLHEWKQTDEKYLQWQQMRQQNRLDNSYEMENPEPQDALDDESGE